MQLEMCFPWILVLFACNVVFLRLQFDAAMEEYHKALQQKTYETAAKHLGKVGNNVTCGICKAKLGYLHNARLNELEEAPVVSRIDTLLLCFFLIKTRASVEALKAWNSSDLPLLRALSSELTVQRENLIYHLGEEWKQLVVWKLPPAKG